MCLLPSTPILCLSLESTPVAVRAALAKVAETASAAGVEPGAVGSVELVLAEVLNNVVEHAFGERPDGRILLDMSVVQCGLRVRIRDNGRPMPGLSAPEGKPARIDVENADLPEGGFGWFLIRSLTTDVAYTHRGNWNELNLRFAQGTPD